MASVYNLISSSDPTHIRYVGISKYDDISIRFAMHKSRRNQNNNLPLYKWMRKHDDVLAKLVADKLTWEEACLLEVEQISNLKFRAQTIKLHGWRGGCRQPF
jgi:hypothetical protein